MKENNKDLSSQLKIYTFAFNRIIHDFNNIIMILMGYIDLLERDLIETGNADKKIQVIKLASKRTMITIKQMMIFKDMLAKDQDLDKMTQQDMTTAWIIFKNKD